MANFCRSPVAEFLLNQRFKDLVEIKSAGIIQFDEVGMDKRSIEFLSQSYDGIPLHQPRKISKKDLDESDKIYAMDIHILMSLNQKYKNYKNKFQIFGLKDENIIINDPFKMNNNEYIKIMKKIEYVSLNISLKV